MTLSADSIKLTYEEKEFHDLGRVPYASIPALKVGKLAVNKKLSDAARQKEYGSFMLQMTRAYAFDMNEMGAACRFLTVDADIYSCAIIQFAGRKRALCKTSADWVLFMRNVWQNI